MNLLTTNPFDDDHIQEECAVFGIFGTNEASINTALGLHALQHRGQEPARHDGKSFRHRGIGHVGENFGAGSAHIESLTGHVAIGHNRYSTSGKSNAFLEIQPFSSELALVDLCWPTMETSPMRPGCDRPLLKPVPFPILI